MKKAKQFVKNLEKEGMMHIVVIYLNALGHPEWHIKDNVIKLLKGNCVFETMDGMIVLIQY